MHREARKGTTHLPLSQKSYSPSFSLARKTEIQSFIAPRRRVWANLDNHSTKEPQQPCSSTQSLLAPNDRAKARAPLGSSPGGEPLKTERDKGVRARTPTGFSIGEQGEGNRPPYSGSSPLQHYPSPWKDWRVVTPLPPKHRPLPSALFLFFYPLNPICTDTPALVLPADWARAKQRLKGPAGPTEESHKNIISSWISQQDLPHL